MNIDPSKIILSEKDIEDYIEANPDLVMTNRGTGIYYWLARQFKVPSGIIDLLGFDEAGMPIVVELKKGPIDAAALAQVSRYAHDIYQVLIMSDEKWLNHKPLKVVIGSSIDDQAMHEALALDIQVMVFQVQVSIQTYRQSWKKEYKAKLLSRYYDMTESDVFGTLFDYHRWSQLQPQHRQPKIDLPALDEFIDQLDIADELEDLPVNGRATE